MVRYRSKKVKMGKEIIRNMPPNGAVATAVIPDIIRAPVRRMKKCLMYIVPIVLRLNQ